MCVEEFKHIFVRLLELFDLENYVLSWLFWCLLLLGLRVANTIFHIEKYDNDTKKTFPAWKSKSTIFICIIYMHNST